MRRSLFWQVLFVLQAFCSGFNENLICDDFYHYTCAGWLQSQTKPASEPFWNIYTETANRISHILKEILESSGFTNIMDEKRLYNACAKDADYIKEFRIVIKKLGGVQQAAYKKKDYNYLEHIIQVIKLLNIHPILKLDAKQNILHIERGDLIFPDIFLSNPERYSAELNIYATWIERSLALLQAENRDEPFVTGITKATKHIKTSAIVAQEIVAFEVELVQLKRGHSTKISTEHGKLIEFFKQAFHTNIKEVFIDELYFDSLEKLLERTHWRRVSNYIIWSAIKGLSRDVNAGYRQLSFSVDRQLLGVTADVPRERECIDQTINYIGYENLQENYEKVTQQNHKQMASEVTAIANEIREVLMAAVRNNEGLSRKARTYILKKVTNVKLEVLSPRNGRANNHPESSIHTAKLKLGNNHFVNVLKLKAWTFAKKMQETPTQNNGTHSAGDIHWPGSIFDVNAFYSRAQNAIILPLGILQAPFFSSAQPTALNYGALGSLIGHEFSHVLDNLDRRELTPNDLKLFQERRTCVRSIFNFSQASEELAINENIADFIGIRLSYFAMENNASNEVRDESADELFFMNYAKMWCELSADDTKEILVQDEHLPVALRVKTTLHNFAKYFQTFNCVKQQPSLNQCQFW